MTLTGRPTLIDRPELVDRGNQEDEEDENIEVQTLGSGGGPVLHQLQFEPGDYNIVAASNAIAVLSTADEDGNLFSQTFRNAAIQLHELDSAGQDFSDLTRFAIEKDIADIGLTDSDIQQLRATTVFDSEAEDTETSETPDVEVDDIEVEDVDGVEESENEDIENIEESIDEVKEEAENQEDTEDNEE